MKGYKGLKRTAAAALAVTLLAGMVPANNGVFLSANLGIVAKAYDGIPQNGDIANNVTNSRYFVGNVSNCSYEVT